MLDIRDQKVNRVTKMEPLRGSANSDLSATKYYATPEVVPLHQRLIYFFHRFIVNTIRVAPIIVRDHRQSDDVPCFHEEA